jgi:hypothetical protein
VEGSACELLDEVEIRGDANEDVTRRGLRFRAPAHPEKAERDKERKYLFEHDDLNKVVLRKPFSSSNENFFKRNKS